MWQEYRAIQARLLLIRRQIESIASADDAVTRLTLAPGIGQWTATAITAFAGTGTQFKSGRHLAAWLGLVPREFSTGGKQRLFGISNVETHICASCCCMVLAPVFCIWIEPKIISVSG
ncbi:transposase [Paraburkholderia youngii]|uniref:Transposase n=1 Tax=Paraburkholderia youngii TaxID=2782701 RepID=A0A7W8LCB0_9BURK|nr:transposase [Paraburkholderia youngii]MBB5404405.1 transposase [Paraburkholderia youngii]